VVGVPADIFSVKILPNEPAPTYQQSQSTAPIDPVAAARSNMFNFANAENVMIGTDQCVHLSNFEALADAQLPEISSTDRIGARLNQTWIR
jgi:cobyrinic acid a,c-diamide synthase